MLMVISPAKTLDFETPAGIDMFTQPAFTDQSQALIDGLRKLTPDAIQDLMGVSNNIAELNHARFMNFSLPFSPENAKQAVFAFKGDVYTGLDAESLPVQAIQYAQSHLLMLSGLYGLLKPLDLMQPYRLEMGTKFGIAEARNLYQFWDNTITDGINARLAETGADTLLNLASNEYFKSVKVKSLQARVVTPVFKDLKNGQYKMISFYAKKARGLMARFVLLNQIDQVDDCKNFDLEGYHFVPEASDHQTLTFHRDHAE